MHVSADRPTSSHMQPVSGKDGLLTRVWHAGRRTCRGRAATQEVVPLHARKACLLLETAEFASHCNLVRSPFSAAERRPKSSTAWLHAGSWLGVHSVVQPGNRQGHGSWGRGVMEMSVKDAEPPPYMTM